MWCDELGMDLLLACIDCTKNLFKTARANLKGENAIGIKNICHHDFERWEFQLANRGTLS